MSGILDFLRAAIAPSALAVSSYGQGKQEELDKQRVENRQSLLDQVASERADAEIAANKARADYYEHGGAYGMRAGAEPRPYTINTTNGIYQWNPKTQQYEPTGLDAPVKPPTGRGGGSGASATAQDRINAKTALDEAVRATPKPSTVPANVLGKDAKGRSTMVPNPLHQRAVDDSLNYDRTILQPLRKHLNDVTIGDKVLLGGSDPTATPSASAPAASDPATTGAAGGGATVTPGVTAGGINLSSSTPIGGGATTPKAAPDNDPAMRGEYDHAAQQLQSVLNSTVPDNVKKQAQASYDMRLAGIAKKYGQVAGPE